MAKDEDNKGTDPQAAEGKPAKEVDPANDPEVRVVYKGVADTRKLTVDDLKVLGVRAEGELEFRRNKPVKLRESIAKAIVKSPKVTNFHIVD